MCLRHDEPRKDSDYLHGGAEGWGSEGSQAKQRAGDLNFYYVYRTQLESDFVTFNCT